jgi:hypothetical protein
MCCLIASIFFKIKKSRPLNLEAHILSLEGRDNVQNFIYIWVGAFRVPVRPVRTYPTWIPPLWSRPGRQCLVPPPCPGSPPGCGESRWLRWTMHVCYKRHTVLYSVHQALSNRQGRWTGWEGKCEKEKKTGLEFFLFLLFSSVTFKASTTTTKFPVPVGINVFFYYFCLMIEASESVSLTNGSRSERPKNTGSKDPDQVQKKSLRWARIQDPDLC